MSKKKTYTYTEWINLPKHKRNGWRDFEWIEKLNKTNKVK
jgi:hypothetical protein